MSDSTRRKRGERRGGKTHVVEQLVEILVLESVETRFLTVQSSEGEFSFGESPIDDAILIDRRTRRLGSESFVDSKGRTRIRV